LVSIILAPSEREIRPAEVLGNLLKWLSSTDLDHELIIAVDGGRPDLLHSFQEQAAGRSGVKIVALNTHQGQLATIRAGIAVSSGRYIVTFPAYPQVECAAIPSILESLESGADYVIGYRINRKDSIFNRIASRLYNRFIHGATGVRFRDIACGLHGLRREIASSIPSYGDNQVFMPILAAREGFKLVEVPVPHDPTEPKVRFFSPGTYIRRALSLVSLAFLVRFTEKPLRPFGAVGGLLFLIGLVLGCILTWQRLVQGQPLAGRPMLLLALLLVTAGIQVIIVGLIGELLVYLHFRDQTRYRVMERIGSTRKEDRK
jgi:glycosyltransferase involved in cell wall biosynthesis